MVLGWIVVMVIHLFLNLFCSVCALLPPVAPIAMISSTSYVTSELAAVIFNCTTTGIPLPSISWFRNEDGNQTRLTLDSRVTTINVTSTQNLSTLVFEVVQSLTLFNTTGSDRGNYSCQAMNSAGQSMVSFQLIVQGEGVSSYVHVCVCKNLMNKSFCPLFFPVFPFVTVFPQNSIVIQPETANFTCIASGFPAPNLQWFKQDGMNLSLLSNSTKYQISSMTAENLTEGYLMIIEADPFDAGIYICEASNVLGQNSQNSSLQVNGEKMSQIPCIL